MSSGGARTPDHARPGLDLLQAQLTAIESWHRARRVAEEAARSGGSSREMRLDLSRRMEARRREQAALVARADAHLRESGAVLESRPRTRAVIAHRSAWLRDAVAARLVEHGITLVGVFEDGADVAGAVVVEQPELVLVEDRLPSLTGADVVRRVRRFSPLTVVGAHVLDSTGVQHLVEAGAQAVFTRRIRPLDIADQLLACLSEQRDPADLLDSTAGRRSSVDPATSGAGGM